MRLLLFCLLAATALSAQTAPAKVPNFSGYWELRMDSFSVPRATLTPAGQAGEADATKRDLEAIRRCQPMGVPGLMLDRPVLNLQQSAGVIGMVPKGPASVRYIYFDGRPHPAADEWEGATNGHSVAKWEGDTLVVDTFGFNDRGITSIPGGGWRTAESKLTERYRLMVNGLVLSVQSTWQDPKIFAKPHTYELRYYKVMQIVDPRTHNCLANDAERTKFLAPAAVVVR